MISDHDAERRYLEGCFADPSMIRMHPVASDAFFNAQHRDVYDALASIDERGESLTEAKLAAELTNMNRPVTRDWQPMQNIMPRYCDDPEATVQQLRSMQVMRRVHLQGTEALRHLAQRKLTLAEVQAQLRTLADAADAADTARTSGVSMNDVLQRAIGDVDARLRGDGETQLPSGIPALDVHLGGGWDRADLCVLAGDSGTGKSTTMLLAARAQVRAGERVLIVSLEDSLARWARRALHSHTSIPIRELKKPSLMASEAGVRFESMRDAQVDEAIWFAPTLGGTMEEVLHAIRRNRAKHDVSVVYIDYLQAVGGAKGDNDKAMRHHIRDCLQLTRAETERPNEKPLTIVWGSQYKKREDPTKMPRNGDLYEAAYIEQKADAIVHLWKDGDGTRHWALGKHKDEGFAEGLVFRDADGLISGRRSKPPRDEFDEDPQQTIPH